MLVRQSPPFTPMGPFQVLDFSHTPDTKNPVTVIMFHGFGADAYDLADLRLEIPHGQKYRWLFPQGPKPAEIGSGTSGRAWFPIDIRALEQALAQGREIRYAELRPAGLNEACHQALSFLKALNVPLERVVLGGFSQGSMLALEIALALPSPPLGLILLSGALVDRLSLRSKISRLKDVRIFQSHGEFDPILPFTGAHALHSELVSAEANVSWVSFSGGHEIPKKVLNELSSFLRAYPL